MSETETKAVYLFTEFVRVRRASFGEPDTRYKAQWVSRGTGAVVYTSSTKDKREDAEKLARAWLAKNPVYREG
jgi:hypothetical protein